VAAKYERGEVWIVDFGFVAKIRPALILSVGDDEQDRALVTCVSHTTSLRSSQYEIPVSASFLKPGAFLVQNLVTVSRAKLMNRLGRLAAEDLEKVEAGVRSWPGL